MMNLEHKVSRWVAAVNKLQSVLLEVGWEPIPLPQVVLVGDQGCGKSSVLEALVGETIIPCNRATKRPLILQLVSSSHGSAKSDAWFEFVHRPNKIFNDVEAVMEEIELEMERIAGRDTGISTNPIVLKLHSNEVMNMTFIDLPGLTRLRVGDQPLDIENPIKNTVMKYMKLQNSIILAVLAANTNVETSETIQLVKQADPFGERTIYVVTKLDLMDFGTNAMDVLLGNVVETKIGVVGLVNRSQKNIDDGFTIAEALSKEWEFLEQKYKPIANLHGCCCLNEKLSQAVLKCIKSKLPEIKERIREDLESCNMHLLPLGKVIDVTQEGLLCLLTKFVSAYSDSISGTCKNIGTNELEGGARIGYIFQEIYPRALQSLRCQDLYDKAAILTAIRNSAGTKPSLFIPQHCFEQLVKKQIMALAEPSVCCVRLIQDELVTMILSCDKELAHLIKRFPRLHCKIFQVVGNLVKSRVTETIEMVENLINMHTAYINTAHPDFLEDTYRFRLIFSDLSGMMAEKRMSNQIYSVKNETTHEEIGLISNSPPNECLLIENMIKSYFNIIMKSVADAVPKIIMHFMVNFISDNLLTELVACVYSEGDPTVLLEETPDIAEQRERITKDINSLDNALSVINEFMKMH